MSLNIDNKQINIASIILAGGKGERLYPLTQNHSKPSVRYGGRYRLIDIPISNSLNSNIRQIFVIGQYLTAELQLHLSNTYQFDSFLPGSLQFLSPEEYPSGEKIWFDGTADAIRKNLDKILKSPVEYFLILSGDQLYNINFKKMLEFAIKKDADLTIASLPVEEEEAKRLGLLKTNEDDYITDFYEKPKDKDALSHFTVASSMCKRLGAQKSCSYYLASMGIYIFKRKALETLLFEDKREDFGKHLIPTQLKKGKTAAFLYDGYWEDIGTIESFYHANLALTGPSFGLKTYDEQNPIFSSVQHLPGAKIEGSEITHSIICEGSIIEAAKIENSILGLRSKIGKGSIIRDSVLLGNNTYLSQASKTTFPKNYQIGQNCLIEKAIIDEHVIIGNNVKLINEKKLMHYDGDGLYVRDGIIIVTMHTELPDNFVF